MSTYNDVNYRPEPSPGWRATPPRLLRDVGRVMAIDAIAVLPGSHGIRSLGLPME